MQNRQRMMVIVATLTCFCAASATSQVQNDRAIEPINSPVEPMSNRSLNPMDPATGEAGIDAPPPPEVPDERDAAVYEQDDHLHTTPDKMFQIFERLDVDSDRRVQWGELQEQDYPLPRKEFKRLDADGSGDLDRGEFVAISPSPESQYAEPGFPEP